MSNENNNRFNNPNSEINPTMPPAKAAIYGLIIVFLLFQFGGGVLYLLIFGTDIANANISAVRLLNVGGQILFILAPAIILAKLVYDDKVSFILKAKLPSIKETLLFVGGLAILLPLLQSFIYVQNFIFQKIVEFFPALQSTKDFIDNLDKMMNGTYGMLLNANSIFEMAFVIIVVSVTPAICEEMFFRGFVQSSFELVRKPFVAILITAIAFALYHFNPYGLLALIILASYLGFAAQTSQSIVIPMVLHFLNNFISVVMYYIWGDEELMNTSIVKAEEFYMQFPIFIGLSILFIIFLYYIKRNYYKFK